MVWIIGVLVVGFLLALTFKAQDDKRKQKELLDGVLFSDNMVKYLGGFSERSAILDRFVHVKLYADKLVVDLTSAYKEIKEIPLQDIIDVESSTDEQISNDISLGRLIVFGWLAVGMKKKTTEIKRCAVITFIDHRVEKERTLVLEMFPDKLVSSILNLKQQTNNSNKVEQVTN